MRSLWLSLVFLLICCVPDSQAQIFQGLGDSLPAAKTGANCRTVPVTSATAGTLMVSSIVHQVRFGTSRLAAVGVCFAPVSEPTPGAVPNCATALTDPTKAQPCMPPGDNGYPWDVADGWKGPICGILQDGVIPVDISVCTW